MKWHWKALQLVTVVPVAVLAALAASIALAGVGDAFARRDVLGFWNFCGQLLFAAMLLIPLFAVFSLYFAIMQDPAAVRARPKLAALVIVGLVSGILLALIVLPREFTTDDPSLVAWTLFLVLPTALAVFHIVSIARAGRGSAHRPQPGARPLE